MGPDRTARSPATPDPHPVGVIGAGPGGLAAARNLAARRLPVEVLERGDAPGGLWNFGAPGSVLYDTAHLLSSKATTQYPDFPMPEELPDYPHHTRIREYLNDYVRTFDLDRHIRYGSEVVSAEPLGAESGTGWTVGLASGEERRYRALVIANGHLHTPRRPEIPGRFSGPTMHSAEYRLPDVLRGRRVLVIGCGNSGADIAVDSAQYGEATFLSMRRGYHCIPKYVLGRPADQTGLLMKKLRLPLFLRRFLATTGIRLTQGSYRDIGLPEPDHALWETHPLLNSLLPYYVRHGTIEPKPDVAELQGSRVRFADGSREEIDLIVYATGYELTFPFIDRRHLNWKEGRPELHLHVFHPERDDLFVVGMIQPDGGVFGLFHWQARAIAAFLAGLESGTPAARRFRRRKAETGADGLRPIDYASSPRHLLELDWWKYDRRIRQVGKRLARGLDEGVGRPSRKRSLTPAPP